MNREEAIRAKPSSYCPTEILDDQVLLNVVYVDFQGGEHAGQVVVHRGVAGDILKVFDLMLRIRFPLAKVVPIAHPDYAWDDDKSCNDNNSSAFNYRTIAGTSRLSKHAFGRAIDLNPVQNPYIGYDEKGSEVFRAPASAKYDENEPGTLYKEHPVVKLFKDLGWIWGGDWAKEEGRVDYQHFEKMV